MLTHLEFKRADLFIESSSFVFSALAGTLVVNGGLALLIVATPVGWVAVIAGLAVAGVAATTSIKINSAMQENSGFWYDAILEGIDVK